MSKKKFVYRRAKRWSVIALLVGLWGSFVRFLESFSDIDGMGGDGY